MDNWYEQRHAVEQNHGEIALFKFSYLLKKKKKMESELDYIGNSQFMQGSNRITLNHSFGSNGLLLSVDAVKFKFLLVD